MDLNYLTKVLEERTGRSSSVVELALKSIFVRLSRPTTINILNSLGIDTSKDKIEVLREIANKIDSFKPRQKQYIHEKLSGVFHINILISLLDELKFPINNC